MQDITNRGSSPQGVPTTASAPLQESGGSPRQGHTIFTCKALPYDYHSPSTANHSTVGAYIVKTNLQASASVPELDQSLLTGEVVHLQPMVEFCLRSFILVRRTADGATVWQILEIRQQLSDAQRGRNAAMESIPFYTSPQGYKMCLRVYLNGDGIGKNSHMSLFFVIMKGEFDNILQWPFTHKVTFKLINQTGGRDIIDTFQPDPMSSSFRKPKSDMNVASGCPRFVSHTELKSGDFVKDDAIFIKCIIEGEV